MFARAGDSLVVFLCVFFFAYYQGGTIHDDWHHPDNNNYFPPAETSNDHRFSSGSNIDWKCLEVKIDVVKADAKLQ